MKSGEPPVTSILLSTDMFTLIDEDAIVPFDDLIKTADDQAWLKGFYPAFMENSQTGGKTWGIPFQRSTIVLYYNKEMFKEAGLDPNKPPANWKEMAEYAQKLTKRDASRQGHAMGRADSVVGLPVLAVPGARDRERRQPDERGGHRDLLRQAGGDRARCSTGSTSSNKYKVHPEGIVEWGTTPKDFFEKKVAMMWTTTGNLTNVKSNAKFDFGVAMLPAGKQRGSPTGGGNFYIFKKSTPAQREAAFKFIKWVTTPAARGAVGHRHRLRRRARRRVGNAGDEEVRRGISRRPQSRATSCRSRRPSCRRTTTSA